MVHLAWRRVSRSLAQAVLADQWHFRCLRSLAQRPVSRTWQFLAVSTEPDGIDQERVLRAALEGRLRRRQRAPHRVGRTWIQTDTLVEGVGGRRIGWAVQLSTID
ncbi:hypothetical protein DVZ84_34080 [Streptomyces parvulus]|uniref:Uncharacterized protein n=1 Tax=Streptomyces parvulus TaxID=146923 RepID=A0A369UVX5_9ACTN|nr:hypothetical protein DVZ84_34080 [Streptomyces parvulus]